MTLIEVWAQLTPEQRDALQWEIDRQRAQWQRDLVESRKATEAVQAAAEEERVKLLAELRRRGDRLAELMTENLTRMNMVRENAAGLVLAVKALEALRDLVKCGRVSNDARGWPGEVFRAIEEADAVLMKHGIPF